MAQQSEMFDRKILIVDDNAANVKVLKTMLLRAGYLYVTTTTQPTSVCALQQESSFNLILLDITMPGFDGFRVMESLSTVKTDSPPAILVITAQPSHKLRAMQAGAKD